MIDVHDLDRIAAETGFSGAVRVDRAGDTLVATAYGFADRRWQIPNTVDTRFAIASGTKGLTALTVVSLIDDGFLERSTTARSLLGDDLPLIGDDVTVEHLLGHRSGIGDYLDEEVEQDLNGYLMPVPVHELATTDDYLAVLDRRPTKFAPDERFAYCNSGYVVLALLAERASGVPFHELVRARVCERAGMRATEFLRSDALPANTAAGYLEIDGEWRTNVFHLPVRGSGDGGIYSTVSDLRSLWTSFFEGAIVARDWVAKMTRPRSVAGTKSYGLGFWLDPPVGAVLLEGIDAGVSFRSTHHPEADLTYTVVSNTTNGAWPLVRHLADRLTPTA